MDVWNRNIVQFMVMMLVFVRYNIGLGMFRNIVMQIQMAHDLANDLVGWFTQSITLDFQRTKKRAHILSIQNKTKQNTLVVILNKTALLEWQASLK